MTTANNPLVSICIPTYNGMRFIADALHSAVNQTYKNIEIIISDDNSRDNTIEFAKDYLADKGISHKILRHRHSSIGANWNNCILNSNGEYIKFLFQDDIIEPNCIEEMVQTFNEYPDVGLVACKRTIITENSLYNKGHVVEWMSNCQDLQATIDIAKKDTFFISKDIFKSEDFFTTPKNKIGEPSVVMFKRSIIQEIGVFRTDLEQILDWEYWCRILKRHRVCVLNKSMAKFRLHNSQATHINAANKKRKGSSDSHIFNKVLYNEYINLLSEENTKILRRKNSLRSSMLYKIKMFKRKILPV